MTRLPLKAIRFCNCCGDSLALKNRSLCYTCLTASIKRHKELSTKRKRLKAQSLRHQQALARQDRLNFIASNLAIQAQINWMERNDLLPDSRRSDYDEVKSEAARSPRRANP